MCKLQIDKEIVFVSVCVCVLGERQVERNNSLVTLVLHLCYTLYFIFVTYSMAFCPVFHFLAFRPCTFSGILSGYRLSQ